MTQRPDSSFGIFPFVASRLPRKKARVISSVARSLARFAHRRHRRRVSELVCGRFIPRPGLNAAVQSGISVFVYYSSSAGHRGLTTILAEQERDDYSSFPAGAREGDELFPWDLISLSPTCRKTGIVVPLLFCKNRR